MSLKITILGCGGAGGVPLIGDVWGACDPQNTRNRRTRVSARVQSDEATLLIDTSPDMREQLLAAHVRDVTAIAYTHEHADHSHGIDNIRSLNWLTGRTMPVYAAPDTLAALRARFGYIFDPPPATARFTRPSVDPRVIDGPFTVDDMTITPFVQAHGEIETLGFRINDFAYSTDVVELGEEAFAILAGVRVWVVDAIRERAHPTHAHLDKALAWIGRVKPERAYLTHMDHSMDYDSLLKALPSGVEPAYDGLVFSV